MRVLKNNDLSTFEALVKLPQDVLKNTMKLYLDKNYNEVVDTPTYTYAVGDIPIALVAHLDTVFKAPPTNIYYDKEKGVLWSPEGLGADDRAGVFAIIKILRTGLRPHIIFTTDEEKGGVGAAIFSQTHIKPPMDIKYIIELDRHGTNDCVFYDCENQEFNDYVESFGFTEAWGTYSDICEFCPQWEIAGVNLSIGYEDEHSIAETLHVAPLLATIDKVCQMLREAETAKYFKYIPGYSRYFRYLKGYDCLYPENFSIKCEKCKDIFSEYEVIPVKGKDNTTKFYCPDCIAKYDIQWCAKCGEACEVNKRDYTRAFICKDCKKEAEKE